MLAQLVRSGNLPGAIARSGARRPVQPYAARWSRCSRDGIVHRRLCRAVVVQVAVSDAPRLFSLNWWSTLASS